MENHEHVIAVVDDDELVRRALCRILTSLRYIPLPFASPEEFIRFLPALKPDCALVDLFMPGMDGLELLQVLETRQEASPPVIIVTASEDPEAESICRNLGAAAFLQKPIEMSTVMSAIAKVLRQSAPS